MPVHSPPLLRGSVSQTIVKSDLSTATIDAQGPAEQANN